MITGKDYLANMKYKIEGIFAVKAHPSGATLRSEKTFVQYLNSIPGVLLWLIEQKEFKELYVYDLETRTDITDHILGLVDKLEKDNGKEAKG